MIQTSCILFECGSVIKITSGIMIFFSAPSAPPEGLVAASVSSTSFVISWSPPPISQQNGIIREYTVNITELQTGTSIILNSTSTSVSVLSLHPYYTYECAVSAYTVGSGPYSEVFTITTSENGTLDFFCFLLICVCLLNATTVVKCSILDTCELYCLDYKQFANLLSYLPIPNFNLHNSLPVILNIIYNNVV